MDIRFVGKHLNKVDSKGRVSVPASFRAIIKGDQKPGGDCQFYWRRDPKRPALECFTEFLWGQVEALVEKTGLEDDERDDIQEEWFVASTAIEPDGEGRIVLPRDDAEELGLQGQVLFAGYGERFRIWSPKVHEEHQRARREAKARRQSAGGAEGQA